MTWIRVIAAVLLLSSSPAWATTLSWNSSNESDLVGYHVYQCTQLPCTRTSSTASFLATVGRETSLDLGALTANHYYFLTAYDSTNKESGESNVVTFTAAGTPPPPGSGGAPPTPTGLTVNFGR